MTVELENWVKVREFEDLGWARRNRFWVRDDQMPAMLLFQGHLVDDAPEGGVLTPWEDLRWLESTVATPETYQLWVLRRDEVRASHILNMHHKVTFEINPTPLERKIVWCVFLAGAFNIGLWGTLPLFVQSTGSLQVAFIAAATLSVVAVGLIYRWLSKSPSS